MINRFIVDYEYGIAEVITKQNLKDKSEAEILFNSLAGECFGIRKSIGEVTIKNMELDCDSIPQRVTTPTDNRIYDYDLHLGTLGLMLAKVRQASMGQKKDLLKGWYHVLVHSGGDLICWNRKGKKIKSEFDD